MKETPFLLPMHPVIGASKSRTNSAGACANEAMNCSTIISCTAQATCRSARFSHRHKVGLLASGSSRSAAVCHAKSCRRVS